jgi:tetratricopeptide (TPR) repeat protein
MIDQAERDKQIAQGERLWNRGEISRAEACFRLAVAADPGSAQAHAQLAWCLPESTRTQEAIRHLRTAKDLDPASEKVLESLAKLLVRAGEFDEADQTFRRVLRLNPHSATSLAGVVGCRRFREEDRGLASMIAAAAEESGRTEKQQAHLHRAAGKAYDDLGEYATAMRHFDESNRISEIMSKKEGKAFNAEALGQYTDLLLEAFTADRFDQPASVGSRSELPVLIVGMIRSGTTLMDQMLSRHPDIASAGELNYWTSPHPGVFMRGLLQGRIDLAQANEICSEYRILLRKSGLSESRVIDKMPMNFLGLGLIHLLFPNARIIHCRRNPIDTCLSIYVTELGTPRANFAVSRRNIVAMYRQYLRLMEHWRTVLPPDRFLEVDYEAVVADQETQATRVVDFLGLEWDPVCVDTSSLGVVSTPSAWQARQPVYSTSVERWRRYEPWLGELAELSAPSESTGI